MSDNPQIDNLLIIGFSDKPDSLYRNFEKLAEFTRITHITKPKDAATILLQEQFGIVIIDEQAPNFNTVNLSIAIKESYSLTRIIVMSEVVSTKLLLKLINESAVDSFIPLPIDNFTAYSIVLEQQAKFQIGYMLQQFVIKPPKFTPAYYLLHDSSLDKVGQQSELIYLGIVVNYKSVTKFIDFSKGFHHVDDYLLSGYISAITLLGEQLFESNEMIEEINFGGTSIFFHFIDGLQLSVFFRNVSRNNVETAENIVSKISEGLAKHCHGLLFNPNSLDEDQMESIKTNLDEQIQPSKYLAQANKKEKLYNIVLVGKPIPEFIETLKDSSTKFDFSWYSRPERLLSHISKFQVDVVIIPISFAKRDKTKSIAAKIKDTSPNTQIIGFLQQVKIEHLVILLNSESFDYVITKRDFANNFEKYLIKASRVSREIMLTSSPLRLQYAFNQSTTARLILKKEASSFQQITVPELYGVFIIQEIIPYFSKFFDGDEQNFTFDPLLFSGFISSLISFSDETFDADDLFSGMKFGEANLLIKHYYDFTFVFFVKMDASNYNLIHKHIEMSVANFYGLIIQNQIDTYSELDIRDKLDQAAIELFLKLSSMSPS